MNHENDPLGGDVLLTHSTDEVLALLHAKRCGRLEVLAEIQAILLQPELWEERVRRALAFVTEELTRPGHGSDCGALDV